MGKIAGQWRSNIRRARRLGQILGQLAQLRWRHGGNVIEGGVHQGGAGPEQDVAAIPGSAATDLFLDTAGAPVKGECAIRAARILKTDGAEAELVIPVGVVR